VSAFYVVYVVNVRFNDFWAVLLCQAGIKLGIDAYQLEVGAIALSFPLGQDE